jgi:quinol monooxygenase YgiN
VTVINLITPKPDRMEEVITHLEALGRELARTAPGFLSANLHRVRDGRLINYAQWESQHDLETMLAGHGADIQRLQELAERVEPMRCEVLSCIVAP